MTEKEPKYPLLIYDAQCGFCDRMVQTVLRKERKKSIYFLPRQSALGQQLRKANNIPENADSMVFLEQDSDGKVHAYLHSSATLRIAKYLSGFWRLLSIGKIVPVPIRDWFYKIFARNRYRFFGRSEHCILPSPEFRSRFLEDDWENTRQELK
jgi:predicted DCC family thiol-disulfide oxidoreductase YuxK